MTTLKVFESDEYRYGYRTGYAAGVSATFNPRLRWISVKDRLPDDGRLVLAAFTAHDAGDQRVVRQLHYNYTLLMWLDEDSEDVNLYGWEVTHWMELPEPPNE